MNGHSMSKVIHNFTIRIESSVVIYSEDKSDWYKCTGMSASLLGSINDAYG